MWILPVICHILYSVDIIYFYIYVDIYHLQALIWISNYSTRTNASKTNELSAESTVCIQVLSSSQWDCIKILPSGYDIIAQQRNTFIGFVTWYFLESMNN